MEADVESCLSYLTYLPLLFSTTAEILVGSLAIIALLIGSALISGSEVAYFSLSPNDYERLQQEGGAQAQRILGLKDAPRRLLATILISNNFINIAIVLLSDYLLRRFLADAVLWQWGTVLHESLAPFSGLSVEQIANALSFVITVVGVTFLLVLFGEVIPKVYAQLNRVTLAQWMSGPLTILMRLLSPLSGLLVSGTTIVEQRLERRTPGATLTSREDIDEAIDLTAGSTEEESGVQDVDFLKRIIKFGDVMVRQIMRSRVDVVAVDWQVDYAELLSTVRDSGYSRIPIFEEDSDNIIGILYAKDLLGHLNESSDFKWQDLIRSEVLFVPESKPIQDLLREFQLEKLHMAIVVDEYGGCIGIVTLEDILEEVIGDIQDEFDDQPEVIYQRIDDRNYVFEGKTMLNDVYRIIGLDTDAFDEVKGEADSLAGVLLEMVGDLPEAEQEIDHDTFRFKVLSVNKRRIEEILITLNPSD